MDQVWKGLSNLDPRDPGGFYKKPLLRSIIYQIYDKYLCSCLPAIANLVSCINKQYNIVEVYEIEMNRRYFYFIDKSLNICIVL